MYRCDKSIGLGGEEQVCDTYLSDFGRARSWKQPAGSQQRSLLVLGETTTTDLN